MRDAIETVLAMIAIARGAQPSLFTSRCKRGPHLLAPTGANLDLLGAPGAGIAKFHYDMNLVTGHGRASCPGLNIWDYHWRRIPVRVPDGCFLMQAGWQLWYATGGEIMFGFHEVAGCEEMGPFIACERALGRTPIRVSTSFFYHWESDRYLYPIGPFANPNNRDSFPRYAAGRQVGDELNAIFSEAA
jgi:hypothetical protein